jgi:hypothetical protein
MVDQKATQLTSSDATADTDWLYFVDDPAGTPVSKARSIGEFIGDHASASSDINLGTDTDSVFTPVSFAASKYAANTGTAFPTDTDILADGYQFHRTDIDNGVWCYYDETNTQWLTLTEYTSGEVNRDAISASETRYAGLLRSDYDVHITRIPSKTYVDTTNNSSDYWDITIQGTNDAESANTTIYTFPTDSDAADTWTRHDSAPTDANPTNQGMLEVRAVKNGLAGDISYNVTIYYRYIIT